MSWVRTLVPSHALAIPLMPWTIWKCDTKTLLQICRRWTSNHALLNYKWKRKCKEHVAKATCLDKNISLLKHAQLMWYNLSEVWVLGTMHLQQHPCVLVS